jgi:hypothetical protein
MGHPGKDRTLSLLRDRFYWPGMYKDAESWIEQCGRCLRRKTPTNRRSSMVVILYKMLLISFILLYSLIIGLWPVSFLCGFLLACKYSMHFLMFESKACTETDFTGQECTKMQSPGLSNVENVFDEKLQSICAVLTFAPPLKKILTFSVKDRYQLNYFIDNVSIS